jgi:hypothetical protein
MNGPMDAADAKHSTNTLQLPVAAIAIAGPTAVRFVLSKQKSRTAITIVLKQAMEGTAET